MIKRYINFVNESDEIGKSLDSTSYDEIKSEVKKMIEDTISNSGGEFSTFLEKLLKNQEDTLVDGFVNDSEIYEFYLKYRNDIDEVLSTIKFFTERPTDVNAYGLYEYVIKGTQKAFIEVVKML